MSNIEVIDNQRVRINNVVINIDGQSVSGAVLVNKNQDAEFFKYVTPPGSIGTGGAPLLDDFATLRSDESNNYNWRFVEKQSAENLLEQIRKKNPTAFPGGQSELQQKFYNDPNVVRELNTLRRTSFSDPKGFNSPQVSQTLPGGSNFAPESSTTETEPKLDLKDVPELNKGIKSRIGSIKDHGNYRYPSEMPLDMDKIKFNMYSYGVRAVREEFVGFSSVRKNIELKGSVILGIQPRISDRNSVSWADLDANAIQLALAGASQSLATAGASAISGIVDKITNTINAENSNIQAYARTALAGQAAGISGLTSRIGGAILNPNLELLFEGPQLRPFDFTFQLTPRDAPEAKLVKQIIRFFKQGMAVQRTDTELFLKAPNIFKITYMFGEKDDHPGLNKIKDCALMSCNVDYTPTGSYMTFSDGTMTAYSITLSFKELEPVYADEYDVDKQANETVDSVRIGF
jgi:hypothetical protein